MPKRPHSRPIPDILTPPWGARRFNGAPLTLTRPVRIRRGRTTTSRQTSPVNVIHDRVRVWLRGLRPEVQGAQAQSAHGQPGTAKVGVLHVQPRSRFS
jgi:hypothetical protein